MHLYFTVSLLMFAASILASPKLSFDTDRYNCGLAIEGKTDKIKAVFKVKNDGDLPLKLLSVKPGCGCTIVKYNDLIAPGKSTKIEAVVDIKGYPSGAFSKYIIVRSNASEEPDRLFIDATVEAAVDLSENYLTIEPGDSPIPKTLFLISKKTDLRVSGVMFKSDKYPDNSQKVVSIPASFTFTPVDSVRTDKRKVYKLTITRLDYDTTLYGTVIIKLNHPDRKEVTVRCRLTR